jgi:hypothetical protein
MADKKHPAGGNQRGNNGKKQQSVFHTTASTQRQAILQNLQLVVGKGLTTLEIRYVLGVMSPAPRVLELRRAGHRIETIRATIVTPDRVEHHNVARYVLISMTELAGES